jgi:transposase-like protein
MNQEFIEEVEQWRNRLLQKHYPILVIDALHSNIRRDHSVEMEATYTIIAVQEDMSRDIIAVEHIPTESSSGWAEVLQKLKDRGVQSTGLIIADGLPGLETSISKVFPMAKFQKCVVHFKRNILRKVRSKHKEEIAADLKEIFNVTDPNFTYEDAKNHFKLFESKWSSSYRFIKNLTNSIVSEYYFTFLKFDYRIRSMIYTTNWVENLNKQYRKVLKIRNSMPTEESVLLIIGKVAMDKVHKYRNYPIYKFKFDKYLFPQKDTFI